MLVFYESVFFLEPPACFTPSPLHCLYLFCALSQRYGSATVHDTDDDDDDVDLESKSEPAKMPAAL